MSVGLPFSKSIFVAPAVFNKLGQGISDCYALDRAHAAIATRPFLWSLLHLRENLLVNETSIPKPSDHS
jgi:hypothetical protein